MPSLLGTTAPGGRLADAVFAGVIMLLVMRPEAPDCDSGTVDKLLSWSAPEISPLPFSVTGALCLSAVAAPVVLPGVRVAEPVVLPWV